ncbi:MAG: glycoside hydrolase family 92 protein [Bacteroidales bacterium]|nr:glycoside hydrolase family 92 protein [Bacteroidales bacterium]
MNDKRQAYKIYIQNISLNGESYPRSYINYEDIKYGGELIITMGSDPSPIFGTSTNMRPASKD